MLFYEIVIFYYLFYRLLCTPEQRSHRCTLDLEDLLSLPPWFISFMSFHVLRYIYRVSSICSS